MSRSKAEIARLNRLHAEKDRLLAEREERILAKQRWLAELELILPM